MLGTIIKGIGAVTKFGKSAVNLGKKVGGYAIKGLSSRRRG